ncbi:Transposase and inactivated derivatives [Actinobacillus ureae]|uniref:IS1595 family transposase n=1 Tax=Actinobacillus ureae TaxID=723 RepID=UPI000E13838C|nr:IS1595 family transposase [Actinobacillus ureae]SUU42523.1 Transposase and inactivated derivatives [Actinobacillus ureae]
MKITHCKLKKSIQRRLLEFFVAEVTARTAADLLGIQANTAALFYHKIRQVIDYHLSLEADEIFEGKIELDESYFGGHRKGKRGRGAAGKVAVFGLLKRQGKVFTVVVENTKTETLLPVIKRKIKPDSWVYTDTYRSYDALDVSEFHHERINHSEIFAERENHINGIESFWSQAKRVLRKYNGINRKSFPLFLKECEFRFNVGTPKMQLKTLRKWCEV